MWSKLVVIDTTVFIYLFLGGGGGGGKLNLCLIYQFCSHQNIKSAPGVDTSLIKVSACAIIIFTTMG